METGTSVQKRAEQDVGQREPTRRGPSYRPAVDILETEEELRVLSDMPGLHPEDIDIDFDKGMLTIHGKVEPRQPAGTSYLLREYGVGDFHRVFQVSEAVDPERITAEYSDGVLVLHLPKIERAKARKIEVRTS